jgi:hypothetical protein
MRAIAVVIASIIIYGASLYLGAKLVREIGNVKFHLEDPVP